MTERVRVYLVRHGEAERDAAGGDARRSLTPEGRERFSAFASSLAARIALSRVVTSPYARARETAEILAGATGAAVAESPQLAPGCSSGRGLLELACSGGAGVALVGHNPEMADAIALAAGRGQKMPPGAVAALDVSDIGAELAWIEAPEQG